MINGLVAGVAIVVILFCTFLAGGYWIVGVMEKEAKKYGNCRLNGLTFTVEKCNRLADDEKTKSAIKSLEKYGYTYHGGELWRPPFGKAPFFVVADDVAEKIRALECGIEGGDYVWARCIAKVLTVIEGAK